MMTLSNGLTAHWSLNEFSDGTTAVDRIDSVTGQAATDWNTVASTPGVRGRAVRLQAANAERLSITDDGTLSIGNDFTVSTWLRMHGSGPGTTEAVLTKGTPGSGSNHDMRLIRYSTGTWNLIFSDGVGFVTLYPAMPTRGRWYHLTFGYDPATGTAWEQVDGGSRVSTVSGVHPASRTAAWTLGSFLSGSLPADVDLDLFGLWHRSLTETEVIAVFNAGHGLSYRSLRESVTTQPLLRP